MILVLDLMLLFSNTLFLRRPKAVLAHWRWYWVSLLIAALANRTFSKYWKWSMFSKASPWTLIIEDSLQMLGYVGGGPSSCGYSGCHLVKGMSAVTLNGEKATMRFQEEFLSHRRGQLRRTLV
eukprot:g36204.t1